MDYRATIGDRFSTIFMDRRGKLTPHCSENFSNAFMHMCGLIQLLLPPFPMKLGDWNTPVVDLGFINLEKAVVVWNHFTSPLEPKKRSVITTNRFF